MEARLEAIKDKEDFDREFLASQKMMRGRLVRIFPVPS
jgi:hypothetical protein